jgi:hypothetical protein
MASTRPSTRSGAFFDQARRAGIRSFVTNAEEDR